MGCVSRSQTPWGGPVSGARLQDPKPGCPAQGRSSGQVGLPSPRFAGAWDRLLLLLAAA